MIGDPAHVLIAKYLDALEGTPAQTDAAAPHFHPCPVCGQLVDCTDLVAIFHHAQREHEPLMPSHS